MNSVQRRLFQTFAQAGGDLSAAFEVERFMQYVEARFATLTPKVRSAVEFGWRAEGGSSYARLAAHLSEHEGTAVSPIALRQRVSRGLRLLEREILGRPWKLPPSSG